jgi:hypothetical protein
MGEKREVLGLDLDVSNFQEGINTAKEGLSSLSEGTNLESVGNLIAGMGEGLLTVGVAALALKTTFDLVFDGDQIKRTDALFENLAQNFGLAGDALKNDLLKAAGGMADTTEVLNSANKAMVGLGQNSDMIPKIMEVARKTTMAFGGELTSNFDQIARAVEIGSTRFLRQQNIIIDQKKAFDDYARSIGVATEELNESGRQQAVFNAVMEFSSKNLKSINTEVETSTTSWVKLKVGVKEASEGIAIAINNIAGPTITRLFTTLGQTLEFVGLKFKKAFGTEAEASAANVDLLSNKLAGLQRQLASMNEGRTGKHGAIYEWIFGTPEDFANGAGVVRQQIKETQAQLDAARAQELAKTKQSEEQKTAVKKEAEAKRNTDQEKVAENELALLADVAKIEEDYTKKEIQNEIQLADAKQRTAAESVKNAKSEAELKEAIAKRQLAAEQMVAAQKAKIEFETNRKDVQEAQMADQKIAELDRKLAQDKIKDEKDYQKEYAQMLQNQLRESKSVFGGIANAAKVSANKASADFNSFGHQGEIIMSTFSKNGETMFEDFGKAAVDHSQTASQLFKSFFLNSLADMAQMEGEMLLLSGLINPGAFAAGAALLALSGAIRAMAGSGGGSSTSSYSGGGAAVGAAGSIGSAGGMAGGGIMPPDAAQPSNAGSLTVNIQGDYLNTAETQTTLLQAIRNATDQTGYQYLQIGQTGAQTY